MIITTITTTCTMSTITISMNFTTVIVTACTMSTIYIHHLARAELGTISSLPLTVGRTSAVCRHESCQRVGRELTPFRLFIGTVCWGYMGIMEKRMESIGIIRIVWGLCRDYRDYVLELCWDNGKENGNYYVHY